MGQFLSRLAVVQNPDGITWTLIEELQYKDDVLGLVVVPIGFVTDGGSVPPFAQGFVNPYGKGFRAFVVHDYLYATQKFERVQCDECLRQALRACGENWLDSDVQYDAVRAGGQSAWLEDQTKYNLKKEDSSDERRKTDRSIPDSNAA